MSKLRTTFYGFMSVSLLSLAACGEGYVTEEYHGVPYTDERTAHHGVAYVRAKMAPAAGPVLEAKEEVAPVKEEVKMPEKEAEPEPAPEPEVKSAEPLFDQKNKK